MTEPIPLPVVVRPIEVRVVRIAPSGGTACHGCHKEIAEVTLIAGHNEQRELDAERYWVQLCDDCMEVIIDHLNDELARKGEEL